MSVSAVTPSHTEPRAPLVEKPVAVRTEEQGRLKVAAHRDEKAAEPIRPAVATSSSGVQSALVSLKKGG